MFHFIWPIALVVFANVIYQICAKSVPGDVNPFASLTVTYLVGAVASALTYFAMDRDAELLREIRAMNWAPYVLGLNVVAREVGFSYAYKAGWQVSMAFLVQSAFLAVILLFVGFFFYKEPLTWNKLLGAAICLAGLYVINIK